ncbi:MAG: exodeoxyribonuclease VII small subunit [Alphaproteobacteria bacterium]|nr:exodeoxyribonuclease VII small subunit [Alphaproteobacteria bacterium]
MPKEIEQMTFEEAMEELETVVRQLESGKIKLDEAVAVYDRGVRLKRFCADKLAAAQSTIDKLVIGKDGTISGKEDFTHDITG